MKFVALSIGALFVTFSTAIHAQPKKAARIGYLSALDAANESSRIEAIRPGLRDLGYIEGNNLSIEYRYADGKPDRLPALAAELVQLKVDLILVAGGITVIRPVKNATKTIPVVMAGVAGDPVAAGLIESLGRPGSNVTGLTLQSRELAGKRLELLKEVVPKINRLAVLHQSAHAPSAQEVKEILPVARALGLTLQTRDLRSADDFDKVFAALNKDRPDGLYTVGGPLMTTNQNRVAAFALKSRVPSIYNNREPVEAGGLVFYGADVVYSYRRVAVYVDRILKGAKPADLPVEQPTKFELVINLKTAKQIGLTIPQSVLYKADMVIK